MQLNKLVTYGFIPSLSLADLGRLKVLLDILQIDISGSWKGEVLLSTNLQETSEFDIEKKTHLPKVFKDHYNSENNEKIAARKNKRKSLPLKVMSNDKSWSQFMPRKAKPKPETAVRTSLQSPRGKFKLQTKKKSASATKALAGPEGEHSFSGKGRN